MRKYLIVPAAALALAGCQTIGAVNTGIAVVASADAKLRDKCAYLESGVSIAETFLGVVPAATNIVRTGANLATAYCSGKPITDFASAMAAMERVIVAVRPLAARRG